MRVKALRGICIGPSRHLKAGETASDLNQSTIDFLTSIKAVAVMPEDDPPPPAPKAKSKDDEAKQPAK